MAGPYEVSQPSDRLLVFLDRLRRDPRIADWQVQQAEEAVRLFRLFAGTHQALLPGVVEPVVNPRDAAQLGELPPAVSEAATGPGWDAVLADARKLMRLRNYSGRTEQSYLEWAERFAGYCGRRPPAELNDVDVKRYLTHLATERRVSAATQNQAFNALLFLFRNVLGQSLGNLQDTVRARRSGNAIPSSEITSPILSVFLVVNVFNVLECWRQKTLKTART